MEERGGRRDEWRDGGKEYRRLLKERERGGKQLSSSKGKEGHQWKKSKRRL